MKRNGDAVIGGRSDAAYARDVLPTGNAMKSILVALIVAAAFLASGRTAGADDWIFHESAYSYSPRWGQEFGPNRFARGPYYTPQYGGFIRSGYRNLNSNVGGRGWNGDYSNHFESWYQVGEQYSY